MPDVGRRRGTQLEFTATATATDPVAGAGSGSGDEQLQSLNPGRSWTD